MNMAAFVLAMVFVNAMVAAHGQTPDVVNSVELVNSPPTTPDIDIVVPLGDGTTITFNNVSDNDNDDVSLKIMADGAKSSIPDGSLPFTGIISNPNGFTISGGVLEISDPVTPGGDPVSITFDFTDEVVVGTYALEYSGNDGIDPSIPGTITIMIFDPNNQACSISATDSIHFGNVQLGRVSDDRNVMVRNDGTQQAGILISGNPWKDQNGKKYMDSGQTRYSLSLEPHDSKVRLTETPTDINAKIPVSGSVGIYFSLLATMTPENPYYGDLGQRITITAFC